MNDGFEAGENSGPDRLLEAAVRRVFDDLSRDEFGEPADVFAVTRDDELLDWLGAADLDADPSPPPGQDPADAELVEMLLAWRRSVTADESEVALPQPSKGADALGGRRTGRRRRVPVMSAVLAVLMVCVGLGVAVQDAMPGDPLWGVSKVLNSERAASIETTAQTRRYLDVAHTELVLGHRAAAAAALADAQREIAQMRSDDDKRELQARQRELTNRLNRTPPASGWIAGSGATTPPSRPREDNVTSVAADEQQARPSRRSFPQAAAPADTPSTISERAMSDEPETVTPDSSAPGSDAPGASGSATELSESAAVVAGSHVEPSRDGGRPASDRPGTGGDAATVSSGSAQSPPPSGAPSSAIADRAEDTDSDSRAERHTESSVPSSTTSIRPAKRPAQSQSQPSPSADRDSSTSSPPERRAHPAARSEPSSISSSAVEAGETVAKDKTVRERRRISPPTATPDPARSTASGAADASTHRVDDHKKAAAVTAGSSGQPSSRTSRSADAKPSSPGSTARLANPDQPQTGTSAETARKHRDGQEQPW